MRRADDMTKSISEIRLNLHAIILSSLHANHKYERTRNDSRK